MAPTIFFKISGYVFFKDFIKNPQTTIALTFLTHIISVIDGVDCDSMKTRKIFRLIFCSNENRTISHHLYQK